MYNGIGLVTPRGSGTSGHVMKNVATVRHRVDYAEQRRKDEERKNMVLPKDAELENHELKRKVEVLVQKWARDNNVKTAYKRDEAKSKIAAKRRELEREHGIAAKEEEAVEPAKEDESERDQKRSKK